MTAPVKLLVINRYGTVHAERFGVTCSVAAHAPKRVEISTLQALVFKLGPCSACWPHQIEYRQHLGGRP